MIPDRFQYFLDDFWNFEHFGNSWTYYWSNLGRRPRICGRYYTKLLQKILESIWEHHTTNIIYGNMRIENFRNFRNLENLRCPVFEFLKFRIPVFLIIRNDEFLKIMKSQRRGIS